MRREEKLANLWKTLISSCQSQSRWCFIVLFMYFINQVKNECISIKRVIKVLKLLSSFYLGPSKQRFTAVPIISSSLTRNYSTLSCLSSRFFKNFNIHPCQMIKWIQAKQIFDVSHFLQNRRFLINVTI